MEKRRYTVVRLLDIKREERLKYIIYESFVSVMNDLKKEYFTPSEFEMWWNYTRIDDTHKAFVREHFRDNGLLKEESLIKV